MIVTDPDSPDPRDWDDEERAAHDAKVENERWLSEHEAPEMAADKPRRTPWISPLYESDFEIWISEQW